MYVVSAGSILSQMDLSFEFLTCVYGAHRFPVPVPDGP